jgi:RimJ/RimL family protein N-acetyltransferase
MFIHKGEQTGAIVEFCLEFVFMEKMSAPELLTPRLKLRLWNASDRAPFAQLSTDPKVMEFLPSPLTRAQSDEFADYIERHFQERGYGLWAVEEIGGAPFIGFVGLNYTRFPAPFTPCTEVGWRLAAEFWGRGYATEAGRAAIQFGFESLRLPEIVSFTTVTHLKSRAVMERLDMHRDPKDDFAHPSLPEGHPLRNHVLYRRLP